MSHRRNTLVVDFSVLPKRPPLDQVKEFLEEDIKIDMADVKTIQLHNLKNCVYIEMHDSGVAPRLQKQHHLKHSFEHLGVHYYIPVYVDGPDTTIRIHDLPPRMANKIISDHIEQYGKVISIHNEVWKNFFPGVPNGVRVVRIRLEKTIPSHIVVDNHTTLVTYRKEANAPTTVTSHTPAKLNDVDTQTNSAKNVTPVAVSTGASEAYNNDNDDDNLIREIENEIAEKRRLSTSTSETSSSVGHDAKRSYCHGYYETGGYKCIEDIHLMLGLDFWGNGKDHRITIRVRRKLKWVVMAA
ncbi:uncharacterized protein LOC134215401 [Armigeres subalbatus]|uniref:uncharacterized protein LOC134215401 n=1 Tax=Armigeres subalbatus TaxID=124917 RepID=UPI002ED2EB39